MVRKKNRSKTRSTVAYTRIKVVGIGGAGCSTLKRMLKEKIPDLEYVAIDTDWRAMQSLGPEVKKVRIGKFLTKGLGTGVDPELGQTAAEQSIKEIKQALKNADIIFLTVGLGGGTGTGAILAVAEALNQTEVLTIAIVTKPFAFEGQQKKVIAEEGLRKLVNRIDTLIVINNDKLLQMIDQSTPILEAFGIADEVLKQGVQAIYDIINVPGLINIDFAEIKPILQNAGLAFLGIGRAKGKDRTSQAIKNVLANPLMDFSIAGAKGVIFVIAGSNDLKMMEINEIAEKIVQQTEKGARIAFGAIIDESLKDEIKITLIATAFESKQSHGFAVQSLDKDEVEQGYLLGQKSREEKKLLPDMEQKKVFVYQEQKNEGNKEVDFDFENEDELEIPAFLRKRFKKKS